MAIEEPSENHEVQGNFSSSINWLAYLAGLTFMAALAAGGEFITQQAATDSLLKDYGILFASFFIGSSTGHYYGKAVDNERKAVNSAYLGAFTLLFSYWVYQNRVSLLTVVLTLMTVSLVLAHHSGLVVNSKFIKKSIDYFAAGLSPLGILLFGAMKYVAPILPFSGMTQTVIASLTQKVSFLGASVNIVIFWIGVLISAAILLLLFLGWSGESE